MGCCTLLLYGPAATSESSVKVGLTAMPGCAGSRPYRTLRVMVRAALRARAVRFEPLGPLVERLGIVGIDVTDAGNAPPATRVA